VRWQLLRGKKEETEMNSKLRNVTIAVAFTMGSAMGQSFTTIENWTDGLGSCGSPGLRLCTNLKCSPPSGNALRSDPYDGLVNCDLPVPACTTYAIPVNYANPDFTFLVVTDLHLRNGYNVSDTNHVRHVHNLNVLPTLGFNWSQAGAGFDNKALDRPIAVVTTGDDTDNGHLSDFGGYRLLYEPGTTSDSIQYPMFPGLGNHDMYYACEFSNCARRMFEYPAAALACAGNVDSASHNYSWDWGPFHMVQLNVWAGDTHLGSDSGFFYSHASGLDWLANDLKTRVGSSGRKVILFQHFGWDYFSMNNNGDPSTVWWTDSDRASLLSVLAPYNVAALFSGHQHVASMNSAAYLDPNENIEILDDFTGGTGGIDEGLGSRGEFYAVRLTNNFLDVLPFEWSASANSTLPAMVDVGRVGNPQDQYSDGTPHYPKFYNDVNGCRKWLGEKLLPVPVTIAFGGANGIKITNNTGSVIKGPFALRFGLQSGDTLNSVSFTGSCAKGPVYQEFVATQLEPGQSDEIALKIDTGNKSASSYSISDFTVVTLGGDSLLASQASVTVTATSPQKVVLSTVFNKNTGFTYKVIGSGLTVSANSAQTPATLTIGVASNATKVSGGLIAITPADPQYFPLNIEVVIGNGK
jgi:hypothetical protein